MLYLTLSKEWCLCEVYKLRKKWAWKIQKKKEHWLAMLCEQTEERGNFIISILSCSRTYITVLIFQITDEYPFCEKKMLENKLMPVTRFAAASCQSNIFYFGIFYHVFMSDSWNISKCGF